MKKQKVFHKLLAKENILFLGALNKLYVSYKRGIFKEAEFPPEVGQINYHVVSSDQGFVMLAVNHEHGISQLFSSTNNGTKYRKVLNNVRYFERKQNNLLADTGNQTKTVINLNKTNYHFYQIKRPFCLNLLLWGYISCLSADVNFLLPLI